MNRITFQTPSYEAPSCSKRCLSVRPSLPVASRNLVRSRRSLFSITCPALVSTERTNTEASNPARGRPDLEKRESIDPSKSQSFSVESYVAGQVCAVHSADDIERVLAEHKNQVVVLELKASHCRPCKGFVKKYSRLAETFQDCVFLEMLGDESGDTCKLMLKWQVKATPTFRFYWQGEHVDTYAGTAEEKIIHTINTILDPDFDAKGENAWLDSQPDMGPNDFQFATNKIKPPSPFNDSVSSIASVEDDLIS